MNVTITPQGMKTLENQYMQAYGVPGALLMEHAAQAIVSALKQLIPGGRALFVCGPGNNGGDGYAAARLWRQAGGQALVRELSPKAAGDAALNRILCLQAGIIPAPAEAALPPCDAIVDALFGTGLERNVQGLAAEIIRSINRSGVPVVAVDIPSGLHGETGRVMGAAVCAAHTVTFHRMKPGLVLQQGANHAGRITVAPILIPGDFGPQDGLRVMEAADIPRLIPPRPRDGHKGSFGRVVIFAGSTGMAGAAAFCAQAAIRAGAGLTYVLCREAILPLVQALAPGAVCIPLPQDPHAAAQAARQALAQADAAAVGCGLSQAEDALPILTAFAAAPCPVVWDADALNLLALHPSKLTPPRNAVLTPHPGEAARLLGRNLTAVLEAPQEALQSLQGQYGCVALIKGARTLMTDGDSTAVNLYGTPAMGKGGSGDVLTGMLAALLARRLPCTALETVQLGVLLHGLAGLRAEALRGENCVTPQDLIDCIRLDADGIA